MNSLGVVMITSHMHGLQTVNGAIYTIFLYACWQVFVILHTGLWGFMFYTDAYFLEKGIYAFFFFFFFFFVFEVLCSTPMLIF